MMRKPSMEFMGIPTKKVGLAKVIKHFLSREYRAKV